MQLVKGALRGLQRLHHLQLDVLQCGDSPLEGPDFVLELLELSRRRNLAGREALLVAYAPRSHQLDVGVGLVLIPSEVGDLGLQLNATTRQLRVAGVELLDLGELGQCALAVLQLCQIGVEPGNVEQFELGEGVGFQRDSSAHRQVH